MKTRIYKYLLIGLLFSFVMSCKEEFLDVAPIATDNEASFYLTQKDAEMATTAVYAQLAYMTAWDRESGMLFGNMASDDADAGGEDPGDVTSFQDIAKLKHLPSNENIRLPYGVFYKAIMLANKALEKLPKIPEIDKEASPAAINQMIAEIKALRALNTFQLTQIYGEVPLVDHVLGSSEFIQPRAKMKDLYAFMEKDLKEAIEVLPTSYDGNNVGRITKGAAMAILAKVYLFGSSYARNYPGDSRFEGLTERWSDALAMAENVINLNAYKLLGADGATYSCWRGPNVSGFRYLFTTAGDNSAEAVLEVQNIQDGLAWLSSRGSSIVHWSGPRYYYDATGAKQTTSYWGFDIPTQSLKNEFEAGDPRLDISIHMAGGNDSINLTGGWYKICFDNTLTGLYQNKYECSYEEYRKNTGSWNEAPMNFKILRFGEVILTAAEAAVMAGNNDKALKYINMIRSRARICGGPANTVPADLTGTVTLDQVKHERRCELALEGKRFYDLVRWGDAEAKLNGFVKGNDESVVFVKGKHEFFPIPQAEVDISKGILKQYPGWE